MFLEATTFYQARKIPEGDADIAKAMECSEGTVRSRLFYARQQLQSLLSDYL